MANVGYCSHIVVIDILLHFDLAAMLEKCVSISGPLQPIEYATVTVNRIGEVQLTVCHTSPL